MKVVILAGGFGTRISEESQFKPKPMVEIGEKPILWHIMKGFSSYGYNDFVICAGYKQHVIKEYFAHYYIYNSDVTFDFSSGNDRFFHVHNAEPWKVTVVDTGLNTMTGGRVKRVKDYIGNEPFLLTYGDGVSDVNIAELVKFHKAHGKMMTISAFNAPQRFGVLDIDKNGNVSELREKADSDAALVNIGFMVCNSEIFDLIEGDSTVFEKEPLSAAAKTGQLAAYKHCGNWQCMDTVREKTQLEQIWASGNAFWKTWKN